MERSLKVRIIKENSSKVTVYFLALNRKMPIPRAEFDERVAQGMYEVVNDPQKEAEEKAAAEAKAAEANEEVSTEETTAE